MDTILVVDDEPGILEAYAHYLGPSRAGARVRSARVSAPAPQAAPAPYRLLLASSAADAVRLFEEERQAGRDVALGIFDMQMPDVDGFTLIQRLRAVDPGLMCLVVTAHQDRPIDEISRYFGTGQDDWAYLAKPFHASEIQQEVRGLVASWRRRRARTQELEEANAALRARTEELNLALERAQAATTAKSDFLAMMSHELRTPMNGVLGMTQALEQTELTASQRQALGVIRESGDAMLLLLNDILDLSKIEAGKLEFELRPFNLRSELKIIVELFRPLIEARGLEFRVELSDSLPVALTGDSPRLRQVLTNLLSNALKFTPTGFVRLSCTSSPLAGNEDRLELVVEDSGIGIARDRRGRLFKSFSQVDSSITRQYGGTGLGLAICGRLCSAMGGEIHLESEPGAGTICRVVLPLPLAAGPVQGPPEPATSTSAASCSRVLVVEDNPINRMVACRLLEACGVRPDLATNGREAVAMVREKEFDLILMDMQMPEMDGLEATRVIRQMALQRRPQIFALTANAFESDRRLCLEADMDGFLAKPLRLIELRALLERMRGES